MVKNRDIYLTQYRSADLRQMEYLQVSEDELKKLEVTMIDDENIQTTLFNELLPDEIFKYFKEMPWMYFSNKNRIYSVSKNWIKSKHKIDTRDNRPDATGNVRCKITNQLEGVKCDCDLHIIIACLFIENPHNYPYVLYHEYITDRTQVYPENLFWSNVRGKISRNLEIQYEDYTYNLEDEQWFSFKDAKSSKLKKYVNHFYSNKGRFRCKDKIILPLPNKEFIKLHENDKSSRKICKLMMDIYNIRKPSDKNSIDHIDSNPYNNSIDNLRWASQEEQSLNQETTLKRKRKLLYKNMDTNVVKTCDGICNLSDDIGISEKTINKYMKEDKICYGYYIIPISNDEYAKCTEYNKYVDNVNFFETDIFELQNTRHISVSKQNVIPIDDAKKYLGKNSRTKKYVFKNVVTKQVRLENHGQKLLKLFDVTYEKLSNIIRDKTVYYDYVIKNLTNEEYIAAMKSKKYIDNELFFEDDIFEFDTNNDDIVINKIDKQEKLEKLKKRKEEVIRKRILYNFFGSKYLKTKKYVYKNIENKVVNVCLSMETLEEVLGRSTKTVRKAIQNEEPYQNYFMKEITNDEYIKYITTGKYVDNVNFFESDCFNVEFKLFFKPKN